MYIRNAHAKLMLCAREKQPRSLTIHKTITTMIAANESNNNNSNISSNESNIKNARNFEIGVC